MTEEVGHNTESTEPVSARNFNVSPQHFIQNAEDEHYVIVDKKLKLENIDRQLEEVDVETTDSPDIIPIDTLETFFRKEKNKIHLKASRNSDSNSTNTRLESCVSEVESRFKQGCDCTSSCFEDLIAEDVYKHRLNVAELTKEEHDMYLMGVTMASLANRQQTHRNKERQRQRASYVYQGKRVCLDAFLYLENVTQYHLKIIRNHLMKHGVTPRVHGNMGKKPYNTFSLDMYKCAESFVKQFIVGHQDKSKPFVVAGETRRSIYNKFMQSGVYPSVDGKIMGFSTFRHFMKKQFPNVKFSPKIEYPKSAAANQLRNEVNVKEKSPKKHSQTVKSAIYSAKQGGKRLTSNNPVLVSTSTDLLVPDSVKSSAQNKTMKLTLEVAESMDNQQLIIDESEEDDRAQTTYFLTHVPIEVALMEQVTDTDQIGEWLISK